MSEAIMIKSFQADSASEVLRLCKDWVKIFNIDETSINFYVDESGGIFTLNVTIGGGNE